MADFTPVDIDHAREFLRKHHWAQGHRRDAEDNRVSNLHFALSCGNGARRFDWGPLIVIESIAIRAGRERPYL